MPLGDLNGMHFTAAEISTLKTSADSILAVLRAKSRNYTPQERKKYGSVAERNKLIINKVRDYRMNQPELSSDDVDWVEFEADYVDRTTLQLLMSKLNNALEIANEKKIAHDYDNFQNSLTDYRFSKYKNSTNRPGFETKVEELSQFFGNGGISEEDEESEQPDDTTPPDTA